MANGQIDTAIANLDEKIKSAEVEQKGAESVLQARILARLAAKKVKNLKLAKVELESLKKEESEVKPK